MRQYVKLFVRKCAVCQKIRADKFPTHPHPFTTSTYVPMQCLNIDFIGPFPDGDSILVIICTFTRWVELYRTPDATSLSAVVYYSTSEDLVLLQRFVPTMGRIFLLK
jgi:hypothetical protein